MGKKSKIMVREGSGNVFADLGFRNAEREQLKDRLTLQIYRPIKGRNLTRAEVGKILGIKQPHVSTRMRGQSGAPNYVPPRPTYSPPARPAPPRVQAPRPRRVAARHRRAVEPLYVSADR